jgi:CheY-like chemotaxis protein
MSVFVNVGFFSDLNYNMISQDLINLSGYTILIADNSKVARSIFGTYIRRARGTVITVTSGKEAISVLRSNKVDLLITDIDIPEVNGFDLIAFAKQSGNRIPSIIITGLHIDEYINLAIEKDIGNILSKEINEHSFVRTCYNLISGKNIFGLGHYLPSAPEINVMKINCSTQIQSVIREINEYGFHKGLNENQKPFLAVILDEILSNAVYHAYGHTEEKESRDVVCLRDDEAVEVRYGYNENHLGISVTDYKGLLTKKTILSSFKNVIDQKKLIEESKKHNVEVLDRITPGGRGLQMIRLMSNDYYFNIKRNSMTEVIALVNISDKAIVYHNSSIRINELA